MCFTDHCKNAEAFLSNPEFRERYCWTCLRGTQYERFEGRFEKFGAHLYEHRWREVIQFLRKSRHLFGILAITFDHDKYLRGTDSNGNLLSAQRQKQERESTDGGRVPFNPKAFRDDLRSSIFIRYATMVELTDSAPAKLVQMLEVCPCHARLIEGLSLHARSKILGKHYVGGKCKSDGKRVPFLAAGYSDVMAAEVWSSLEQDLYIIEVVSVVAVASSADWALLLGDFHMAKAHVLLTIEIKNGYWQVPPCFF